MALCERKETNGNQIGYPARNAYVEPYSAVNNFKEIQYNSTYSSYISSHSNGPINHQSTNLSSQFNQKPVNALNSVSCFQSANMNMNIQSDSYVYPSTQHLDSSNSYYVNNGYQYEQYNQTTLNNCYASDSGVANNWHYGFNNDHLVKTTNESASNNSMSFESVANIDFDLADLDYI